MPGPRDAPQRRPGRGLPRAAAVSLATALLVVALGGGEAFWVCLPAGLLLAAPARGALEALTGGALAGGAAAAPALLAPAYGPLPSLPLALFVVVASAAVLHGVRARLDADRETLRRSAVSDPLTGAMNRRGLAERLAYEVTRHSRQRHQFAVVAIDLDGFKQVNDRFGHHAGDELLRDVADALRHVLRDQDTVARLGGDEFCVLAPETDRAGGEHLAERISRAVQRVTTGLDSLSASVGVAVFPRDGATGSAVLDAADSAQVEAKRHRRARLAA